MPPLTLESTALEEAPIVAGESLISRLTAGLVAGDEEAFREFHERYFDRLYSFLLVIARGREDEAQEALQQTLLRVVRYSRVFQSEEVFWSWLKALARSVARDAGRKRQRYAALLERFSVFWWRQDQERRSPEDTCLRDLVEEILSELPLDERQLVEGKYFSGESVKELSNRTGLTEKAVEARLGRLRQRIRERLIERLHTA